MIVVLRQLIVFCIKGHQHNALDDLLQDRNSIAVVQTVYQSNVHPLP